MCADLLLIMSPVGGNQIGIMDEAILARSAMIEIEIIGVAILVTTVLIDIEDINTDRDLVLLRLLGPL